ncbi:TetR/AcrR family transcriptional regulator [Dehalobacter sp. TBBPA1]|uniref:TetR/AcrR family transcriptional regulator n=1 Tax=Dehalobacter sp. TBBPA1 TaxID=3235037 RepID=UPI0034A2CDE4
MKSQLHMLTTKEKIIQVVIDMIAQDGFQNITNRKIAAKAGVNAAAINYHFGSKDVLINEALKHVMDQLKNIFEYLKTGNEDEETQLSTFINNYIDILFKYPDIIRHMASYAIHHKPLAEHEEYLVFIQTEGFELIKNTIGKKIPELDDSVLSLKTLNLISGLNFPLLMGEHINHYMGVDLSNKEIRQMYKKLLLENVCRRG